jgi:hypothetical protein
VGREGGKDGRRLIGKTLTRRHQHFQRLEDLNYCSFVLLRCGELEI